MFLFQLLMCWFKILHVFIPAHSCLHSWFHTPYCQCTKCVSCPLLLRAGHFNKTYSKKTLPLSIYISSLLCKNYTLPEQNWFLNCGIIIYSWAWPHVLVQNRILNKRFTITYFTLLVVVYEIPYINTYWTSSWVIWHARHSSSFYSSTYGINDHSVILKLWSCSLSVNHITRLDISFRQSSNRFIPIFPRFIDCYSWT